MLVAEWVQLVTCITGVLFTAHWLGRCLINLHVMYRTGRNGVMVMQAWEKIAGGFLTLALQLMWCITALSAWGTDATTPDGIRFETAMAVRGAVGSSIMLLVVIVQRWSWNRILEKDRQLNP